MSIENRSSQESIVCLSSARTALFKVISYLL